MLVKLAEVQALKKNIFKSSFGAFLLKKFLFMNLLFCLLRERQGEGGGRGKENSRGRERENER